MADMSQSQARSAAISAGHSPEEVDAFIAKEGGARTSAQRITSAFGAAGSSGTDDLSAFHAQKAAPAGQDASGRGTYLSGGTALPGTGGGGAASGSMGATTPSAAGLDTALDPSGYGGSASMPMSVQALNSGGSSVAGQGGGGADGSLRPLGQRIPPQSSMALASLGWKVY